MLVKSVEGSRRNVTSRSLVLPVSYKIVVLRYQADQQVLEEDALESALTEVWQRCKGNDSSFLGLQNYMSE
jgi:hypothetical protein